MRGDGRKRHIKADTLENEIRYFLNTGQWQHRLGKTLEGVGIGELTSQLEKAVNHTRDRMSTFAGRCMMELAGQSKNESLLQECREQINATDNPSIRDDLQAECKEIVDSLELSRRSVVEERHIMIKTCPERLDSLANRMLSIARARVNEKQEDALQGMPYEVLENMSEKELQEIQKKREARQEKQLPELEAFKQAVSEAKAKVRELPPHFTADTMVEIESIAEQLSKQDEVQL